jgi:hypothetical protein
MKQMFFALLYLSLTTLSVSQQITNIDRYKVSKAVIVNIEQQWTSTGIRVSAGDTIEIQVAGIASASGRANSQGNYWVGPEGIGDAFNPGHPVPTAASYSVIGKIGTSGTPFYVGSIRTFRVNATDSLFLGYNDNFFSDNYGYYVAFVARRNSPITGRPVDGGIVDQYSLAQNYPNPFNPSTTIEYRLPSRGNVQVNIYNSLGQLVRSLVNEQREAGTHSVVWDGRDNGGSAVATGAYFYQVRTGDFVQAKRMLMLK